jgi:L-2,4-diaminobutyrate decarboxylase
VWFHVDAAHGGSALLSARHRPRLRGIERARSIAWDPHKMMLMPISTGMLLVRDEHELERAFVQHAPYLFHAGNADARIVDQGTRSFACSRRVDAFKVWVALQRYGARGFAALYDHLCDVAHALYEEIGERDDVEAAHEPESNILCFRWVGDRTLDDAALDAHNRELRERYNRSGRGWITTTVLGGRRMLRVTVMNPRTKRAHMRTLLDGLAAEAGAVGMHFAHG